MVMVTGFLGVAMGFAGWHSKVKRLGYKGDKDGNKLP